MQMAALYGVSVGKNRIKKRYSALFGKPHSDIPVFHIPLQQLGVLPRSIED